MNVFNAYFVCSLFIKTDHLRKKTISLCLNLLFHLQRSIRSTRKHMSNDCVLNNFQINRINALPGLIEPCECNPLFQSDATNSNLPVRGEMHDSAAIKTFYTPIHPSHERNNRTLLTYNCGRNHTLKGMFHFASLITVVFFRNSPLEKNRISISLALISPSVCMYMKFYFPCCSFHVNCIIQELLRLFQ